MAANPWSLTERQAEVMDLLVAGGCNKSMAKRLGIGIKTVESHFAGARKAMGAKSRAHAVVLWDRWRRSPEQTAMPTQYAWTAKGMIPHPTGAWTISPPGVTP